MKDTAPLNKKIRARRVILIDSGGNRMGEFLRDDAITLASQEGLDLVQVTFDDTPICRIMDYGKFLYQQKKKNKGRPSAPKLKEVKMTPVTDTHDFKVRVERARSFLEKGHKVKVTVVMHGRHRKFQDQAYTICDEFYEALSDFAQIDSKPQLSGKYLTMIVSRSSE